MEVCKLLLDIQIGFCCKLVENNCFRCKAILEAFYVKLSVPKIKSSVYTFHSKFSHP